MYAIDLCPNGKWKEIIVDDSIPVNSFDKKPAFTSHNGNELWVMLLEKAYAKCFKGYLNVDAGMTLEALRDLTGAPTEMFDPTKDDKDRIWHKLVEGDERNYIMTAGSSSNAGRD